MRRIALVTSLTLIVAACAGDTGATTTEPAAIAAAATTTTTTAPTTTTVPETTTTTTAVPQDLEFETVAGTPPEAFETFAAEMTIVMSIGELDVEVSAEGIWTTDAFSCTVSSGMGGITFNESVIGTPETLWIDAGNGYEEASLFGSSGEDIMSTCPTSPLFWASFAAEDIGVIGGDEELIGGRSAVRADLADLADTLGGLGLMSGFDGAAIHEMTMWIDVETNTVIALIADIEMTEDLMGELSGGADTGPVRMTMDFTITDVNNPALTIDLP